MMWTRWLADILSAVFKSSKIAVRLDLYQDFKCTVIDLSSRKDWKQNLKMLNFCDETNADIILTDDAHYSRCKEITSAVKRRNVSKQITFLTNCSVLFQIISWIDPEENAQMLLFHGSRT